VTGVSGTSFTVADLYGLSVPGTVTYSASSRKATFAPSVPMEPGTIYKAKLTSDVRGALGQRLSTHTWRFTTAGEPAGSITAFTPAASLDLGIGTNTGYKFTLNGKKTAARHASLAMPTTVTTSLQRSISGQPGADWFYVTSGTWKGYWLRASDAVVLDGSTVAAAPEAQVFDPSAVVTIRKGTHTGYTFSTSGAMKATHTSTAVGNREADAAELRALPGQTGMWFRMTSGAWQGYWLRASSVVSLASGG
jgi:hypothetical protein